MKILVISNFYPPVRAWGYTQWCSEVAGKLREQGHEVHILTSRSQFSALATNGSVRRELYLENDLDYYSRKHFFLKWAREDESNKRITRDTIRLLDPDVVFIWGMYGLSRSVPAIAEVSGPQRVVYYISDHWPASPTLHEHHWQPPARSVLGKPIKAALRPFASAILRSRQYPPPLQFDHCMVVSEAVKRSLCRAGLPMENSAVIHGGSDVSVYLNRVASTKFVTDEVPIRLLYAGFLAEHKGVHTAIDAMSILAERELRREWSLSIVGAGRPDYEERLRALVTKHGLEAHVHFQGRVQPDQMPGVLRKNDVLIFPSIYEEPFARIIQEAMLAGLAVVGTTTGGSDEILFEGVTGLTFAAGDPLDLANQVERLVSQPKLRLQIAKQAQDFVLESFTLDRMATEIESYLLGVAAVGSDE